MTTINSDLCLSATVTQLTSSVDPATLSSNKFGVIDDNRTAWQKLIDYKLIEWGSNIDQFDDEGFEPPTAKIISTAIQLANSCRDQDLFPPDSVVPDGDGGIVFERRAGNLAEVIHVWDDGTIEYLQFQGTRLIDRNPLYPL